MIYIDIGTDDKLEIYPGMPIYRSYIGAYMPILAANLQTGDCFCVHLGGPEYRCFGIYGENPRPTVPETHHVDREDAGDRPMTHEQTCGNCKHWGRDNENGVYRSCTAIIHDERSKTNDVWDDFESDDMFDEEERQEFRDARKHQAVAVDGSGYFAALKCREDFGCKLWTEK